MNEHIHTLTLTSHGTHIAVDCDGCDIALRLATADEARAITDADTFAPDGPMVGPHNIVVVPRDFSLYQEA